MNELLKKIGTYGIVPVVKLDNAADAVPLCDALTAGGLPLAEITFRTDAAADAIRRITTERPAMLVGAGTVLTTEQVDAAVEAGAKFIVSPGFNPKVVKYCIDKNIPVTPGCATCGEMEQAMELGLDVVKFFPAEAAGGLAVLKAVSGPYPKLRFMPTGGINEDNLLSYLAFPKVLACGGSFMVKDTLIKAGKFDEIAALTRKAVAKMHGFAIKHIGVNETSDENCRAAALALSRLFMVDPIEYPGAIFCGTLFEVLKKPGRGAHGHVAVSCHSPARARAYLENVGFVFDESSAQYDEKGNLRVIYLRDEIGGFAFHLIPADN